MLRRCLASVCGSATLALASFTASVAAAEQPAIEQPATEHPATEQAAAPRADHSSESRVDRAAPSRASAAAKSNASEGNKGRARQRGRERQRTHERPAPEPSPVAITGRAGLGLISYREHGSSRKGEPVFGAGGSVTFPVAERTRFGLTGYLDEAAFRGLAECLSDDCAVRYLGVGLIINRAVSLKPANNLSLSLAIGRESYTYENEESIEPGGRRTQFTKASVYVTPGAALQVRPRKNRHFGLGPYLEIPMHGSNGRVGYNVGLELLFQP